MGVPPDPQLLEECKLYERWLREVSKKNNTDAVGTPETSSASGSPPSSLDDAAEEVRSSLMAILGTESSRNPTPGPTTGADSTTTPDVDCSNADDERVDEEDDEEEEPDAKRRKTTQGTRAQRPRRSAQSSASARITELYRLTALGNLKRGQVTDRHEAEQEGTPAAPRAASVPRIAEHALGRAAPPAAQAGASASRTATSASGSAATGNRLSSTLLFDGSPAASPPTSAPATSYRNVEQRLEFALEDVAGLRAELEQARGQLAEERKENSVLLAEEWTKGALLAQEAAAALAAEARALDRV